MKRTQIARGVAAVLAIAFFLTPLALIAGGVRVHEFENRRLEAAPKLADGWNLFNVTTRYLIDRMPLRDQAVHANTWISENIFATTPAYGQNGLGGTQADQALPFSGRPDQDRATLGGGSSTTTGSSARTKPGAPPAAPAAPATAVQVTIGTHGWFFLLGVLQRACSPFVPFPFAASEWEKLLGIIRASGRKAILVVAPDKSTIYPEYLSPSTPDLACGKAGTAALWKVIEAPAARRAGIVGLRQPLLAAKRRAPGTLLYYKTDSHWNSVGALTMTQAVLPAFSSTIRVRPSEIVTAPPQHWSGDLLGLIGQSGGETAPVRAISRRPGAPVISAPTLVLGDSYADAVVPEMQPYFSHLTFMNWNSATPQTEAQAIIHAHYVILETVEREFDYRASDAGFIGPGIVSFFREVLSTNPLR